MSGEHQHPNSEQLAPDASAASTKRSAKPARGEHLQIKTHSFAFEGKAVGRREDGYVIFVEGALANETIEVEVQRAKGSFAEAKLIKVVEPAPDRLSPICPYFGLCGGCALQHMAYDSQLFWKRSQVVDLFERIGRIPNAPVHEAIGNAHDYHYRNKMEFSFSEERWLTEAEIASSASLDRFALGMHVRNRFDRVMDTAVCFLPKPVVVDILGFTRTFTKLNDLGVFSPDKKPDGLMRFLVVRTSEATGEIMVNLVTSRFEKEIMERYTEELRKVVPQVTTVVNNVTGKRAQIAVGEYEETIFGSGTISDKIGRATYQISANSFFQTNTPQAEKLYTIACDYADLKSDDYLWDLYCGTGTISLFAADRVRKVLGVELVESAITDANANAKRNGITNVEFVASDLRKALTSPDFQATHGRPDVMIIDPPRSGMHQDVVREVLTLAPERISYISCNPATQARDIELMSEKYIVEAVQPVDMFPQTFHIESVAKLRRR